MATQTVEFAYTTGQTLTVKLFALGSDTVVDTASATEATNRKSIYTADFTDVSAGTYRVIIFVGSNGVGNGFVTLANSTDTYEVSDSIPETLSGANVVTITVQDSSTSDPITGAVVRLSTTTNLVDQKTSNSSGVVLLGANDNTYTLTVTANGYNSSVNTSFTVSGNTSSTVSLTENAISTPSAPGLCTVGFTVLLNGTAVENATVSATLIDQNSTTDGNILSLQTTSATTDSNGSAELELVQLGEFTNGRGKYRIVITTSDGVEIVDEAVTIPNTSTAYFEDLL